MNSEETDRKNDHNQRTLYLKPVEAINFTGQEMLNSVLASVNPSDVASLNQLHGERKGVIRITLNTLQCAEDFNTKVNWVLAFFLFLFSFYYF